MSTPRQRIEGESDESYKAMMVELGKFNEKMYGKKGPGPMPPMTKGPTGGEPQPYKRTASDQANIDSYTNSGRSPERGAMFGAALDKRRQQEALQKQNGRGLPTPPALGPQRMDYSPELVAKMNAFLTAPRTSGPVANLNASPKPIAKGGVVKKAAGGAAKVRKGMMSSEGVITNAMNKIRGK